LDVAKKVKEILAKVKFQVPGGKATPAPPVSPALGQHGANIGQFVQLASVLLKEAAGLAKGSGVPNREKVGKVTRDQVRAIAERKMADLNSKDIEGAQRIIAGSARSIGIEIVD
jgi:large subunit ribosomal protein L11